jgi:hypothetical protein
VRSFSTRTRRLASRSPSRIQATRSSTGLPLCRGAPSPSRWRASSRQGARSATSTATRLLRLRSRGSAPRWRCAASQGSPLPTSSSSSFRSPWTVIFPLNLPFHSLPFHSLPFAFPSLRVPFPSRSLLLSSRTRSCILLQKLWTNLAKTGSGQDRTAALMITLC